MRHGLFLAVLLLVTTTASAAIPISYIDYPVDNTNPTVTACVAYADSGQKCKRCDLSFYPNGMISGYTCVSIAATNYFCTCGDMSKGYCTPKGKCTYV